MHHRQGMLASRLFPAVLIGALCALALGAFPLAAAAAQAQGQGAPALLQRAGTAMAAVKSFHFKLTIPQGSAELTEEIALTGIEGDVQRPDRFRATVTVQASSILTLSIKAIGIGTNLWVTDPTKQQDTYIEVTSGGHQIIPLPELLDPDRLVRAAVAQIQSPKIAGTAKIGNVETTRVDGTIAPGNVTGTAARGGTATASGKGMPVSLWIDATGHVLRVQLTGPLTKNESSDVVHQLDLSQFDEAINIQPPTNAATS